MGSLVLQPQGGDLERAVQMEQLRALYASQRVAVGSGLLLALILVLFLAGVIPLWVTLPWLLSLALVGVLRIWDSRVFLRVQPAESGAARWFIRFRLGVYATACVWGSACVFLFPRNDVWHQAFVGFALAGLGVSVAISYAIDLYSAIPFFAAAILPYMLRMFVPLEDFAVAMGFVILLFLLAVLGSMRRIHLYLLENIKLRLEADRRNAVLQRSEQRFRQMFERPITPMLLIDAQSKRIVAANEAAARFYQYPIEELQILNTRDIETSCVALTSGADIEHRVCKHRLRDRSVRDVDIYVSELMVDESVLDFAIIHDITERKRAEAEVIQLAFYDALTGLPNRRMVKDSLREAIVQAAASGDMGCLIYLDLDHFKNVNDIQGHELGDRLLVEVARRLRLTLADTGLVGRLGGDEFLVLLSGLGGHMQEASLKAAVILERIREVLSQPYFLKSPIPAHTNVMLAQHSTSSIGVSFFGGGRIAAPELLKQAEMAMYQAKRDGRNLTRYFDPAMQRALEEHALLSAELRDALLKQHFEVYFQAQADGGGRAVGAEALLRWKHPERAVVGPEGFIAHIEESGLIVPVGYWVLQYACARLRQWQDGGSRLVLAVNVSAKQFHQGDFVARVRDIVTASGIDARGLKLELTESAVLGDMEDTVAKMEALRQMGLSFSLDDFGTGHSSLKYLKHLPLAQLKIDQSFVRDLGSDANDDAIVDAVIALSRALRLDVIAEGVETASQRDILSAKGCQAFQGYLFGRPQPAAEFEAAWLN